MSEGTDSNHPVASDTPPWPRRGVLLYVRLSLCKRVYTGFGFHYLSAASRLQGTLHFGKTGKVKLFRLSPVADCFASKLARFSLPFSSLRSRKLGCTSGKLERRHPESKRRKVNFFDCLRLPTALQVNLLGFHYLSAASRLQGTLHFGKTGKVKLFF